MRLTSQGELRRALHGLPVVADEALVHALVMPPDVTHHQLVGRVYQDARVVGQWLAVLVPGQLFDRMTRHAAVKDGGVSGVYRLLHRVDVNRERG